MHPVTRWARSRSLIAYRVSRIEDQGIYVLSARFEGTLRYESGAGEDDLPRRRGMEGSTGPSSTRAWRGRAEMARGGRSIPHGQSLTVIRPGAANRRQSALQRAGRRIVHLALGHSVAPALRTVDDGPTATRNRTANRSCPLQTAFAFFLIFINEVAPSFFPSARDAGPKPVLGTFFCVRHIFPTPSCAVLCCPRSETLRLPETGSSTGRPAVGHWQIGLQEGSPTAATSQIRVGDTSHWQASQGHPRMSR
ncbi:hypothetical protein QBC47DRAFT_181616 [Echria macrotheca]|uniref:Uncharacterized protein n=1 Tax=Echria macrotheca TaxID=438768 RepID=A0AAJ0F5W2_9PEZI|nr:hypothetical protein QBC47DRAFT_181616 [Echria macrotheca]